MLNVTILQYQQQNDSINGRYTVVNEMIPIITNLLKTVQLCANNMLKHSNDKDNQMELNALSTHIEQNFNLLNDRNDILIEHQKAMTLLVERKNDLLKQGIDLLSLNEK